MAELGPHSAEAHAEVGRRAAELRVDHLFAVGKMAGVMGAAARAAGLMGGIEVGGVETVAKAVKRFVRPGDGGLIEGSRASRRSGEGRGGEEGRSRGGPDHYKKKREPAPVLAQRVRRVGCHQPPHTIVR